ncbi:DUF4352 domain-containing protein [Eubacteriales bacterium OttesenSCG-928-M02]|nr:DUF4352 domain-containing protein [Eubacteriales bacterium OttesenSCG-928-M02]
MKRKVMLCYVLTVLMLLLVACSTTNSTSENKNGAIKEVMIGETVTIGEWEVKVEGFNTTKVLRHSQFAVRNASDDEAFFACKISAKNLGTADAVFLPFITDSPFVKEKTVGIEVKLIYNDKYEYIPDYGTMMYTIFSATVAPLKTETENLYFDIPAEAAEANIPLVLQLSFEGEVYKWSGVPVAVEVIDDGL